MNKSMWNAEAVKAYESGQGVMMVKEPYPHYVPIPQRTWVGLTRMELIGCGVLPWGMSYKLYKAIEAKLKERNS